MSNYNDFGNDPVQPPVRHRRSDRHRAGGRADNGDRAIQDRAVQDRPSEEAPQEIQWQRRQPAMWQEADEGGKTRAYQARRQESAQDDGLYMRRPLPDDENDADYEDEDAPRRFSFLKIILIALILLALLLAGVYFMKDAGPLNPIKDALNSLIRVQTKAPGEVISFQAASTAGSTNTRLQLNLITNQSVDGVRIADVENNEIACTATLVNGANETNKIWNIVAIFDVPYSGDVYAVIREGDTWTRTDKSVTLLITDPTPAPTEVVTTVAPLPTDTPVPPTDAPQQPTDAPVETPVPQDGGMVAVITWAPTNPPLTVAPETPAPTEIPTPDPTVPPTESPTPLPTEVPTPAPTAVPTATPVPRLDASAASGALKNTDTVYQGGKSVSFSREEGYVAPNPDQYAFYNAGVLTFRGDNFRRNAAFGTVNVEKEQLSVLWQSPIGYLKTADNGTLYGVGWTGQPAIVKWTKEAREGMNIFSEYKDTKALTEVIFGAQDGKIYFLNLRDGTPTRDPINVGYPLKGSVAVDSMCRPLLAVGQGISKLPNKTGSIGLHVYNLATGKEVLFLNGRKSNTQVQYTTNGAFDGTALFLNNNQGTDAMIVAGENGLLYTVDLKGKYNYPSVENPDLAFSIEIDPKITYLRTKSGSEKDAQVNVEGSVAMYDKYIYMADTYGVIRCVDSDTMKTVWAMDGGDNIDASIALDMDGGTGVSLYTGNTAYSRLGSKKDVTIRRMNALTGEEIWTYSIKCDYDKNQLSGCKASPVIGQYGISDLVVFTVNKVSGGGSKILALDKQTGRLVWEHALKDEAVSSPVAVYNEFGDAWIIQGDQGGNLTMLNARTGEVRNTLNLGGAIEGSPAVYRNYLVVGTCSKDNACMYGIRIE